MATTCQGALPSIPRKRDIARGVAVNLACHMTPWQDLGMDLERLMLIVDARRRAQDGSARRIRQQAGLTLAEVAKALGVDESSVSRWEGGSRQPRADVAVRWAQLLAELERKTNAPSRRVAQA